MQIMIKDEKLMEKFGDMLSSLLVPGDIIYLTGELGSGKTTLTRGILRGLNYSGLVTSPTFALMNIYDADITVNHFDLYRLDDKEIFDTGWEDFIGKRGVSIVEWAEKCFNILPQEALYIEIKLIDDDYDLGRMLLISARGERNHYLLNRIKELTA